MELVIDAVQLFMGHSYSSPVLVPPGCNAIIEALEIGTFNAGGSMSSLHQGTPKLAVALGGTFTLPFAGALIVAGTEPSPRGQVSLGGEEPDVSTNLHEDMLSRGSIKTGSAANEVNLMLIRLNLLIDALVELGNSLLQIPQVFQVYANKEAVMLGYPLQTGQQQNQVGMQAYETG